MKFVALLLPAGLVLSAVACAQQPQPEGQQQARGLKERLEQYVRHLFVWGPEVSVRISDPQPAKLPGFHQFEVTAQAGKVSQQETFYVSPDGSKMVRGVVYDLATDPYGETRKAIDTEGQPAFGPASAPVEVVVFSDFQCSFCKEEANILRNELASQYPEQVRVVFKDFPLDAIHPWARPAAIAGHCLHQQKQAAFWSYHDWVFENQQQISTENFAGKLADYAQKAGLDVPRLQSCVEGRATEAKVNASITEAQQLGVNSTPTMFINGRRLVGQVAWPVMKKIIEHEIVYQKERGAGECCELKLPATASK